MSVKINTTIALHYAMVNRWKQQRQGEISESKIIEALHDNGQLSQKELETKSGLSHETIRKKLKTMKEKGKVTIHKVERYNMVRLSDETLIEYEKANWPIIERVIEMRNNGGYYYSSDTLSGIKEDTVYDSQAPLDSLYSCMPPDTEFYRFFITWVAAQWFSRKKVANPNEGGIYIRSFTIDFASLHKDLRGLEYIMNKEIEDFFNDPHLKLKECKTPQEFRSTVMYYFNLFNVAYRLMITNNLFVPRVMGDNEKAKSSDLGKKMDRFLDQILSQADNIVRDLDRNILKEVIAMVEHGENPFLDPKISRLQREGRMYKRYGLVDTLVNEYVTAAFLSKIKDENFKRKLNEFYYEAQSYQLLHQDPDK